MVRWAGLALLFCLAPFVQAAPAEELSRPAHPADFLGALVELEQHEAK